MSRQESPRGRFITLEGLDGCGKTTQAKLLAQALRQRGLPVLETREPGGTAIGKGLRAVLLDPEHGTMLPMCEALLYLADRIQHLEQVIRPALARGEIVVCDRYHDATVAYQQYGRELDFAPLQMLIAQTIAPTRPDLTLWLDVDVALAQQRLLQRQRAQGPAQGAESRLDRADAEFHERVRAGYSRLADAEPERIVRIEGSADPQVVQRAIWARVSDRLGIASE